MTLARVEIDMDAVRALHANGLNLKCIAAALGVAYNTLANRTAAAGLYFRKSRRKGKQAPLPQCAYGHRLTEQGASCAKCRKRNAATSSQAQVRYEQARTRTILDLCVQREHAPHWEKAEITRRIEALRA